jgi:hypothetical protein
MGCQLLVLAWLRKPSIGFAGRMPWELLVTPGGGNNVLRLLHQIDTEGHVRAGSQARNSGEAPGN